MAQSHFKIAQERQILFYAGKLIEHVTKLTPEDQNYEIAESFILSNIHGHTFPDTSTRQVEN
jgi:hypothetical protein